MKKILGVLVLTFAALSITLGQTPEKPKPDSKPVPNQATVPSSHTGNR
jgi:hypothetical protein